MFIIGGLITSVSCIIIFITPAAYTSENWRRMSRSLLLCCRHISRTLKPYYILSGQRSLRVHDDDDSVGVLLSYGRHGKTDAVYGKSTLSPRLLPLPITSPQSVVMMRRTIPTTILRS